MSRFFRILLLVSILFGVSAFAEQARLWMEPVAPTVHTPITFYYDASCEGLNAVGRNGSVITISFNYGPCSPPRVDPLPIPLPEGTLPAGEYRVDVFIDNGPAPPFFRESMSFVVRPDESTAPFRVRPSTTLSTGGAILRLESEGFLCPSFNCTILIGGIE